MSNMIKLPLPLKQVLVWSLTAALLLGIVGHFLFLSDHPYGGSFEQSCSIHHGLVSVDGHILELAKNQTCRFSNQFLDDELLLSIKVTHPPKPAS